jgi:Tol biopolymer transport system component
MKPDGTDRRRIYDVGRGNSWWTAPTWSPDGNRIAIAVWLARDRNGALSTTPNKVLIIDANGVRQHLFDGYTQPIAWQPITRAR